VFLPQMDFKTATDFKNLLRFFVVFAVLEKKFVPLQYKKIRKE
jgi:hypothetical protein